MVVGEVLGSEVDVKNSVELITFIVVNGWNVVSGPKTQKKKFGTFFKSARRFKF